MERLDPKFGEDWPTENEDIDHYLTLISSKIVKILRFWTKFGSDNDRFLQVIQKRKIPDSSLRIYLLIIKAFCRSISVFHNKF